VVRPSRRCVLKALQALPLQALHLAREAWDTSVANRYTSCIYTYFFLFFSGTVERDVAHPYYDKTQRMPHAQSDRDVSYLAMLTAMVEGRILYTGCGFLSHRMFNETQG
jgi:hypothetical protein